MALLRRLLSTMEDFWKIKKFLCIFFVPGQTREFKNTCKPFYRYSTQNIKKKKSSSDKNTSYIYIQGIWEQKATAYIHRTEIL